MSVVSRPPTGPLSPTVSFLVRVLYYIYPLVPYGSGFFSTTSTLDDPNRSPSTLWSKGPSPSPSTVPDLHPRSNHARNLYLHTLDTLDTPTPVVFPCTSESKLSWYYCVSRVE